METISVSEMVLEVVVGEDMVEEAGVELVVVEPLVGELAMEAGLVLGEDLAPVAPVAPVALVV